LPDICHAFTRVRSKRRDINEADDVGLIAGLCDHGTAIGMTNESTRPFSCATILRVRSAFAKRREWIFNSADDVYSIFDSWMMTLLQWAAPPQNLCTRTIVGSFVISILPHPLKRTASGMLTVV
jgi:hypothetical protein